MGDRATNHPRPPRGRRSGAIELLLFSGSLLLGACREEPQANVTKTEVPVARPSLLDPAKLNEALKALIDPLPQPVRILTVTALHEQVIVQVQSSTDPTEVTEYRFLAESGGIKGPTPVTLLGAGKLQDNLFPLQAANPQVAGQALGTVQTEYGPKGLKPKKLVMIRNLPRSRDIQFRVYLDGPDGVLLVNADKTGRLLGAPEPAPDPSN
jgi:hypothetical protein